MVCTGLLSLIRGLVLLQNNFFSLLNLRCVFWQLMTWLMTANCSKLDLLSFSGYLSFSVIKTFYNHILVLFCLAKHRWRSPFSWGIQDIFQWWNFVKWRSGEAVPWHRHSQNKVSPHSLIRTNYLFSDKWIILMFAIFKDIINLRKQTPHCPLPTHPPTH